MRMSEIDELAYRLYLEYLATVNSDYYIARKDIFYNYKETRYKDHYDEAKKILRKEKLKQINSVSLPD